MTEIMQEAAEASTEIMQPAMVEHTFMNRIRRPIAIALTALGSFGIAGCGGGGNSEKTSGAVQVELAANSGTVGGRSTFNERQPSVPMSSTDLANGGYNCGNGLENVASNGEFSYASQIDYLNRDPALANNLVDFNINDPTYGMGQRAWDLLQAKGAINPNTDESKKLNSNEIDKKSELDRHLHQIMQVNAESPRDVINFTCENDEVNPVGMVRVAEDGRKNAYNGVVLTKEDMLDFMAVAKNPERFLILFLGVQKITQPDGTEKETEVYMIDLYLDGCRNPNRLPIGRPGIETPTTTTGTTPNTVPYVTPTTEGPKVPVPPSGAHTQPGDGGDQGIHAEPGCDATISGYCEGQQPPTPTTAEAPTTTYPHNSPTTGEHTATTLPPHTAPTSVDTTAPDGPPPTNVP